MRVVCIQVAIGRGTMRDTASLAATFHVVGAVFMFG